MLRRNGCVHLTLNVWPRPLSELWTSGVNTVLYKEICDLCWVCEKWHKIPHWSPSRALRKPSGTDSDANLDSLYAFVSFHECDITSKSIANGADDSIYNRCVAVMLSPTELEVPSRSSLALPDAILVTFVLLPESLHQTSSGR
jgi:hypothetical protein